MRYLDGIQTLKAYDADNALILGTALHTGIEKNVETAVQEYFNSFPVIDDKHINEAIKLETMIPKAKAMIPEGQFEVLIEDEDFKGFIDLLAPVEDGVFDIYDFKYSNNVDHYMESVQLHLYQYFFEKLNPGKHIRNLYYLCVPKVNIKQKKTETLGQFRTRLWEELKKAEPKLVCVQYDPNKVLDWMFNVKHTLEAAEFPKNQSWLCKYCEFNDYCQKGFDYIMLLPSIENVPVNMEQYKKIWVYGDPFSGKTHLASEAPAPVLELNTDGNVKHYTMPRLSIRDSVISTGRSETKKFGWDTFVQAINELEGGSEFKTIVVDIVDDVYDMCRTCCCDSRGWEHESDDSFKAYDIVRNEFLRTMKRLLNLPYNVILISHEDKSKDITKRGGDKVTQVKPNIPEKVAIKLAGMVDIVIRTEKDHDNYIISTKTNNVIFGGGRLGITKALELKNSWDSIDELYSTTKAEEKVEEPETQGEPDVESKAEETPVEDTTPKTRTRRTRKERD
jgi:CRISPR/Cas system-associated exonuclease Cas4 (RecB family)